MKFQNSSVLNVAAPKLWEFLTEIPSVARCLPGVEEVHPAGEGKYVGVIALKVGMIKLRLTGDIAIELMDAAHYRASMRVEASDARISGMIQGTLAMNLEELAPGETRLMVDTDLNLFGKIGEFGQPMIKRKADQMMAEFSGNVARRVGDLGSPSGGPAGQRSKLGLAEDPPVSG